MWRKASETLPRARSDVRGDHVGLGDHLVLEARVELHVACLVDLLGGQEGGLLLAAVGADEAGELGRDALLGDHQRGQQEEDQLSERSPVIACQSRRSCARSIVNGDHWDSSQRL